MLKSVEVISTTGQTMQSRSPAICRKSTSSDGRGPIFTHKIQASRKDKYDYKRPHWQRVTKQKCMWMAVVI